MGRRKDAATKTDTGRSNGSRPEPRALERTLAELRRLLASGRYPVGSRLPAEREFAVTLRVGRSTLRKALAVLEADGKIWRHVGQGTFVGRTPPGQAIEPVVDVQGASPREVLDARLVLEPAIAQFAAVSARPEDIAYLRRCLEKREAATDPETYEFWDHTLHRAIAEATHNPLLVAFLEIVSRLRREPGWKAYRLSTLTPERRARSALQHRAIVDAIAARNARDAFEAMRTHIDTIRTNLFREQEDGGEGV
ncbi:MAG TPA: FadR/GntR family transcriptional regulator [Thermodesulfobacteriota bacterium]